jgi:CRISPR/Cas system-associated exonuclease Cas4 (RecB family)
MTSIATARPGLPFVWVTWLTAILAGEAECVYAPWFKAHFTFQKREREGGDLAGWAAEHSAVVRARAEELRTADWTVSVERQNEFKLKGQSARLAGKPDIVAHRDGQVLVIDAKTGKAKHGDWWQVLIYMAALPLVWERAIPIHGEIQYRDHTIAIPPDALTPARRAQIFGLLRSVGSSEPPLRVPSSSECAFCDLSAADCPERIDTQVLEVATVEF